MVVVVPYGRKVSEPFLARCLKNHIQQKSYKFVKKIKFFLGEFGVICVEQIEPLVHYI